MCTRIPKLYNIINTVSISRSSRQHAMYGQGGAVLLKQGRGQHASWSIHTYIYIHYTDIATYFCTGIIVNDKTRATPPPPPDNKQTKQKHKT